jgi:copper chaperone CopZ
MFRRAFIQRITTAGAVGIGTCAVVGASENLKSLTFAVKGFTCVTCAVGLEVMLRGKEGVRQAKASFAEAKVVIVFDPELTTQASIEEFISKTGFRVQEVPQQ